MNKNQIEITNVVGSGELPVELELEAVGEAINEYTNEKSYTWRNEDTQSPGLYYEMDGDDGPQLTFHESGSFIVRADSKSELYTAKERMLEEMIDIGVVEKEHVESDLGFEIVNVVALAKIEKEIKLQNLAIGLNEYADYNPEIFPALEYPKTDKYNCAFLVYGNGKVIVSGGSSVEKTKESMVKFYDEMEPWI